MTTERKFLWATLFVRIITLFGILGGLFIVYVRIFIEPDMMEAYASAMIALMGSTLFFSTFPGLRIHIRANQLKKQLSEKFGFNNTLKSLKSTKDEIGRLIILIIIPVITIGFIIFNFMFGTIAYLNSNSLKLFLHMIVVIATIFIFNAFLLIYVIDENFKKLEILFSQWNDEQAKEEKETR